MAFVTIDKNCWRRAISVLIAGFALLNAGCYKATGGGWIPTSMPYTTGGDRANFGFSAMCRNTKMPNGSPGHVLYDGQLEWHDGFVGFHGNVEPFDIMTLAGSCQDVRSTMPEQEMSFKGTYRPQDGGESGLFQVGVRDGGTPGANGDFIIIQLIDGEFHLYENMGILQGGNIQVF
jgi:hypothetical protein